MSYTKLMYHVVFSTKYRRPTLAPAGRTDFLTYCCGIIRGMKGHTYRINCVEDHLHILVGLPATLEVSLFVKRFKLSSGNWLRAQPAFPDFDHWQDQYGAFSESWGAKDRLIEYIKDQEDHHRQESFLDEFKRLIQEAGLEWDPRDEE